MTLWASKIVGHDRVAPDQLLAHPLNYRTHPQAQRDALKAAIEEVGFIRSVTVNRRTGNLIDGHERVWQALTSEQPFIDVEYVDLSPEEERKALATMDPISEMASVDPAKLDELLREVDTGSAALQEMLAELAKDAGLYVTPEVTEDEVPEPPKVPVTKPGDLWILGEHRLLCGDSTKAEDVGRLMGGERAGLCFTSPPYASQRKYDESSGFKPIPPDKYVDWWEPIQSNVAAHLAADGSFFVNIKEHCDDGQRSLYVKELTIAHVRMWQWRFVDELIWTHEGTPINAAADGRFKNAWEPIFHFTKNKRHKIRTDAVLHESGRVAKWVPGRGNKTTQGNFGINGDVSTGLALPSNNIKINKGEGRDDSAKHSAKFPVSLPGFFIRAFSDESDIVTDIFLGSGTTIIAAQQLSRRCYGLEISPAYCDVIIQRWENLTGGKAKRDGSNAKAKPQAKKKPAKLAKSK